MTFKQHLRHAVAFVLAVVFAVIVMFVLAAAFNGFAKAFGATPAASDHQPPRFLPAVVLYDRFLVIEVGKTFSYTCKAALDDAQATIEKATAARSPAGRTLRTGPHVQPS